MLTCKTQQKSYKPFPVIKQTESQYSRLDVFRKRMFWGLFVFKNVYTFGNRLIYLVYLHP